MKLRKERGPDCWPRRPRLLASAPPPRRCGRSVRPRPLLETEKRGPERPEVGTGLAQSRVRDSAKGPKTVSSEGGIMNKSGNKGGSPDRRETKTVVRPGPFRGR